MSSSNGFAETCSSNPERVGRDGFLGLRFEHRHGRTVLGQCRFKLTLQALTPTELADGTAYLMLLNPTGGLVGGDFLFTRIIQEAGTRVCLTTPSATRVYRTRDRPTVQETWIRVGEGASLEFLPDHVIPHRDSHLHQSLRVEMGRGSRAIFWDALAGGRVAHGELWNFREVNSRTEISLCGRTVLLNRTTIRPAELDPKRLGFTEDFNYLATLAIVADELNNWKETVTAMDAELKNMPQVYGGVSVLASGGCVLKLLARSASDLVRAQMTLWARARQIVFGSPPSISESIELADYRHLPVGSCSTLVCESRFQCWCACDNARAECSAEENSNNLPSGGRWSHNPNLLSSRSRRREFNPRSFSRSTRRSNKSARSCTFLSCWRSSAWISMVHRGSLLRMRKGSIVDQGSPRERGPETVVHLLNV